MLDPKVSVIVPVYNSEAYLSMCIESILKQSYYNIEIILIDDGSTDTSLGICCEYSKRDPRVKVFHQDNKGVSAARNYGIDVSEGEYIMFVDSDDELLRDGIYVLLNDIKHFDADIATGSKLYISHNHKEINRSLELGSDALIFKGTESLELSLALDRRMTSCHGKLFCKQFVSDIRFVEGKRINEDFYYIFLCSMKLPRLTYRDACVYKYFYRENSSTHSDFNEKYFDMLYFAEQKKLLIEKHYPELLEKAINMEISTHLFMLNMLCKSNGSKYRDAELKSIQYVKCHYKTYFSVHKFEKRLAWIVAHGLYPLYKLLVRMKYYR